MVVSSSIGLLILGVASGIFLFIGLRARKNSKTKRVDNGCCACCLASFLISRSVRCNDCGAKSCLKSCSRWNTSDNAWNCIFCHQRRAWIKRNEKCFENFDDTTNEKEKLHSFFGTAKFHVAENAVATNVQEQTQENQEEKRTVHVIQNFVEQVVEGLIDNVNDTSIDRLYKNSEYDKFLDKHRSPLIAALTRLATCLETSLMNKPSMDPPAAAHAALKEIVERAVVEARKLPGLGPSADTEHPTESRPIAQSDHSYEDLLATAILNKVVERFQRERVDGNSNVLHDIDSPKAKYTTTESEHGLEEDAASHTSYRRECNGNHSAIRRNGHNREPVSFMMEEQIEEVTTITSDDDGHDIIEFECSRRVPFPELGMDIVDPPRELSSPSSSDSSDLDRNEYSTRTKRHVAGQAIDLISPVESWEDNWLFQKKRTSRTQPDSVAMLVPSSNAYYKALIGDRDAEDTSDLSECSSTKSDEEIEKELMEAINNVVPRTPRTSECDAKNNQTENNPEVPNIVMQFGKDEIDICQVRETEKNLPENVCEHFDEKINETFSKSSEISEKKTIEDVNDKEKLSESSFALITAAKEEDETKEKPKDTADCGERINAITVESSVRKDTQSEKASERNDRTDNVVDEDEEQRESEYTEHYDTAIQRHLDSLTKVEVCSGENEITDETSETIDQLRQLENNSIEEHESECLQTKVQLSYATTNENHIGMTSENDRLSTPPRPGTIAEREHKKWENAPPIENNPYSEESIRKRCLERQYSRNSDIPGAHYDLKKLNEVNLETLLAPDRPDIKRFGRDYYINQSKAASGERPEQATRSTMSSMSSRPSSSLSQRSSCTGNEQHEQQEESTISKETDDISIMQEDNIKVTEELCRRNNAEVISHETNNRSVNSRTSIDTDDDQKVKCDKGAPDQTTWKDHQQTDDILEDQRKNSKNEINAKLNNQEHNLETECKNDEKRKVRKIDLKAYGFENEFTDKKRIIRQQRVVNKLDLKSFGYQDGLRRACSNNQLDQPLRNNEKSNLTRRAIERLKFKGYLIDAPQSLGCKDFAKSSRDLHKLRDKVEEVGLGLISAKSMPNVGDEMYYHANPVHVNENRDQQDELTARNLLDRAIDKSEEETTTDERDAIVDEDESLPNSYDEISSDVDRSFEDVFIRSKEQFRATGKEWRTMPSVKRLAEAFGRRQISETETTVLAKVAKIDDIKDRSFTPEIQIIETPRQMHSLTARFLSKEFREGLRQMPGKVSSPPVSRSLIEERPTNRTEIIRSKREDNDTDVISPGKLKSNIIFWEQMQKRS
ncbi:uncharacterized protein [Anoplolepis gracilipes]|uniref:uncharacterized protein isoform X4 n=1 Tax=Anoplolepis gracilipes TaxID=354296 RepID=UPI003B9E6796